MKFRDLLISAAAAAMATFAAGAAGAAVITDTFTFTATGFQSAFGQPVPTDPVTGSFTVTFDPTQTYFNQTVGIAMNSLNLTLDSAVSFDYAPTATTFSDGSGVDAGELIIGGLDDGAAQVQISPTTQNDFYVHIDDAVTAPVMQQLGYTSSSLGAQAYFYTPAPEPISVTTAVPEPAAWLLMILGVGCIGSALRMSRKTASFAA